MDRYDLRDIAGSCQVITEDGRPGLGGGESVGVGAQRLRDIGSLRRTAALGGSPAGYEYVD
jgi:hypothetical protein